MNLDAEYWLSLAAQWIQSKSQTQMSFPTNFPNNFNSHITIPEPPRISTIDATANDNLVEADMEIDEEVKDEEPADWQANTNTKTETQNQSNQHQQEVKERSSPVVQPHRNIHQSNRNNHKNFTNKKPRKTFTQIPNAPIIGSVSEAARAESNSQSVDMVLDSDAEENDNSPSVLEAQKRKKLLPIWIREGLERIEREKRQEALRIQKEKEDEVLTASRKKMMEEALKELERENLAKSKFVSCWIC